MTSVRSLALLGFSFLSGAFAPAVQAEEHARAVKLERLWQQGAEDDSSIFGAVSQVRTDAAGHSYVLDSQLSQIHVISPGGDPVRTIGRRGEGPGEFDGFPVDLFLWSDSALGVVQMFPPALPRLTTEGAGLDDFKLADSESGDRFLVSAQASPDMLAVVSARNARTESGGTAMKRWLSLYARSGEAPVLLHEESYEWDARREWDEQRHSYFSTRWALAQDGRVAAGLDFDTYRIHLWDANGSPTGTIEGHAKPLARSDDQLKRYDDLGRAIIAGFDDASFELSTVHAAIQGLWFRADGSLWVLSSQGRFGKEAENGPVVDVYDTAGSPRDRLALQIGDWNPVEDAVFMDEERLYLVSDFLSGQITLQGGGISSGPTEPVMVTAFRLPDDLTH